MALLRSPALTETGSVESAIATMKRKRGKVEDEDAGHAVEVAEDSDAPWAGEGG